MIPKMIERIQQQPPQQLVTSHQLHQQRQQLRQWGGGSGAKLQRPQLQQSLPIIQQQQQTMNKRPTDFIVTCPHCSEYIWIEQINCGIFRHAAYIANNEAIPPHTSREECMRLLENNLVQGCAGPFRLVLTEKKIKSENKETDGSSNSGNDNSDVDEKVIITYDAVVCDYI